MCLNDEMTKLRIEIEDVKRQMAELKVALLLSGVLPPSGPVPPGAGHIIQFRDREGIVRLEIGLAADGTPGINAYAAHGGGCATIGVTPEGQPYLSVGRAGRVGIACMAEPNGTAALILNSYNDRGTAPETRPR